MEQQIGPTNTGPEGQQMIAQDVVLGQAKKHLQAPHGRERPFLLHDAAKTANLQKVATTCGETIGKVSLVTDSRAPNPRYKHCSGWHVDCTINLGSGRSEEQGRQVDPERSPRPRGKGSYV
jgi:hypothetical protein